MPGSSTGEGFARAAALVLAVTSSTTALSGEEVVAAPIVLACVDARGQLVKAQIAQSSGHAEIDAAALEVARAARFNAAPEPTDPKEKKKWKKKRKDQSCVKFKVKFVIRDGQFVPEGA